jgi:hypothetical protein
LLPGRQQQQQQQPQQQQHQQQQQQQCSTQVFLSKLVTWAGPSNNKFTSEKAVQRKLQP